MAGLPIKANLITKLPRNIPGRAHGHVTFSIIWPAGKTTYRCWCAKSLNPLIAVFERRFNQIPIDLQNLASGKIEAYVRNGKGLLRKQTLALCNGIHSIDVAISEARKAWNQLPKEQNDQNISVPVTPIVK